MNFVKVMKYGAAATGGLILFNNSMTLWNGLGFVSIILSIYINTLRPEISLSIFTIVIMGIIALLSYLFIQEDGEIGQEVSATIRKASFTYLHSQYEIIGFLVAICGSCLWVFFNNKIAIFFMLGSFASLLGAYINMFLATHANRITLNSISNGVISGMRSSLLSGMVGSLSVHILSIAVIATAYYFDLGSPISYCSIGVITGSALVCVIARLGGGIFTKAADVGADLVGKLDYDLNEDDPRNPATIADNVGDNVGDCAGMSADITETFIVSNLSVLCLCNIYNINPKFLIIFNSLGILSSLIALLNSYFIKNTDNLINTFFNSTALVVSTGSFIANIYQLINIKSLIGANIGILIVLLLLKATSYYTECQYQPVQSIVLASESGHGTNVIAGLSVGFQAIGVYAIIIISGLVGFNFLGWEGKLSAILAMVAFSPSVLVLDLFGPVVDNAGGIAVMSELSEDIRDKTDQLDRLGNTTKAITKGYASVMAIFAAIMLFTLFQHDIKSILGIVVKFNFDNNGLIGLLAGSAMPYIFSYFAINSVSKAANYITSLIKEQFESNEDLLSGDEYPDIEPVIKYLSRISLREMILPSLLPVIFATVLLVVFVVVRQLGSNEFNVRILLNIFGIFMLGNTVSGSLLSLFMSISGGAWDNSKKYIEEQGLKQTDQYKSSVTGDTVGDPFKDTSGPSLNSLIKLTNVIGILVVLILRKILN